MKFNYRARTKTGEIQVGVIEASSREAAFALLRRYGLYVTVLEEEKKAAPLVKEIKFLKKATIKDVVLLTRQLSIMFKSEIPLVEVLRTIHAQTTNPDLKEKIRTISEEVQGGTPFSQALSLYPKVFSHFYVSMVKSGELSGKLSECLEYLADYLEKQYQLAQNIKGALIYPMLVLAMAIVMIFFMAFFIMPQLSDILRETNIELPVMTKFILNLGDFLRKWVFLLILVPVVLIFSFSQYKKTEKGKKIIEKIFLKVPLIGSLFKMIYLSRFAADLSTLISGGLPVADALGTAADMIGNACYKEVILKTRDDVKKGETISNSLSYFPELFPPLFTQMVLVGEKTGKVDTVLKEINAFYQREIDRGIQNLVTLLEPAMIIFLGLIVGVAAVSIITPLYKMISAF